MNSTCIAILNYLIYFSESEALLKITKRKVTAASDFRTFNGYDLDELSEWYPDILYDHLYDIQDDIKQVFVSNNPECEFFGVEDLSGNYFVYKQYDPDYGPGWFEVDFAALADYLQ